MNKTKGCLIANFATVPEKVFERLCEKNSGVASLEISGAYDHRKAELTMKKLYDKVPASVWTFVRE
ncbi:Hha/YmoA family nucleoid-associated regulatory protein (plasmid) [Escherichia coli]